MGVTGFNFLLFFMSNFFGTSSRVSDLEQLAIILIHLSFFLSLLFFQVVTFLLEGYVSLTHKNKMI